ncbi:MAG: hypothetical protein PHY08_10615 [Candidatus Cloacimonetes bacterium]|nr:hypothetical protein [Candidatus Cloacimonadota bacterium]
MKLIFYKNSEHLWACITSGILLQIVLLYVVIYTKAIESIIIFIACLIAYLMIIFFTRKSLFKKVEINNYEIIVRYKEKVKETFRWSDINDVTKGFHYRTRNLIFTNNYGQKIIINVNNKKIRKIIEVCPKNDLKEKIKNIRFVF